MRVSVISTVLNEASTIDLLMKSLLEQERKPDEIVIVDGGSRDGTWEKIKEWEKKFKEKGIKFKAILAEGANIAEGRNIAIENASYDLIATIDGGCVAEKHWLKELLNSYEEGFVVSGSFRALADSWIERKFARLLVPSKFEEDFPPSARNSLFKKEAWKKAGKYPEWLYTAEDTEFNLKLREAGYKFKFAEKAIVYWKMRSSLKKFSKQFFRYGEGDARAGTFFKFLKHRSDRYAKSCFFVVSSFTLFSLLSLLNPIFSSLFLLYFLEGLKKARTIDDFFVLPFLNFIKRISYVLGFYYGLFKRP